METENNEQTSSEPTKPTPPPDDYDKEPEEKVKIKEVHHHHYHERRVFSFGRIFLGLIILLIGIYFLAQTTGWLPANLTFDWWQLWPILIIFIGLSMFRVRGWVSAVIGTLVTIIVLGVVVVLLFAPASFYGSNRITQDIPISIAKDTKVSSTVLNLTDYAGSINIFGDTQNLVEGNLRTNIMNLTTSTSVTNTVQTVNLGIDGNWQNFVDSKSNELALHLSSSTPFKINIESGASSMNFDLQQVILEALDINTGASSLTLALGDKATSTAVNVKAGASSVNVTLPKDVGAQAVIDSGLTSNQLDDFTKIGDKLYQSNNYASSTKKADFNFKLGVSSLKISWR